LLRRLIPATHLYATLCHGPMVLGRSRMVRCGPRMGGLSGHDDSAGGSPLLRGLREGSSGGVRCAGGSGRARTRVRRPYLCSGGAGHQRGGKAHRHGRDSASCHASEWALLS
jgi:hypothetical protein